MSIWNLPSASEFLNKIELSLRDGNNIIIPTPVIPPEGLFSAISSKLSTNSFGFLELEFVKSYSPIDQFFDHFLSDHTHARSISNLINNLPKGKIIYIKNINVSILNKWIAFICDFDSSVRNISIFDRPLLLLIISGVSFESINVPGVAVKIFPWNNILGDLDIQVYVNLKYPYHKSNNKFIHNLYCRVICNLALWDIKLADYLISIEPSHLLNPFPILYSAIHDMPHLSVLKQDWISGGEMYFDGSKLSHSFLLKDEIDLNKEISSRIWSAQASILFPLIEKYRRMIIHKYKSSININNVSDFYIEDIYDLEIGALSFLINKSKFNNSLKNKVNKLRVIRNKLAHLELITYDEAAFLDPKFLQF